VPLITLITSLLDAKGVNVSRESQPAAQTDFTSLANKAIAQNAKVVVFAGQVASNAQVFFQQLKSKGYKGDFLATDGAFDSSQFTVPGAYISSFSLDINDVPIAKPYVAAFKAKYGDTISFGAPSFVATQAIAMGVSTACADGKVSRGEVRREIGKVKMKNSLLGKPISFDANGDVIGGVGFTMFQIGSGGQYNVVQKG
jgi:ABC-type branched-subunit amino acid transport system substrate-binding protein